MASKKSPAKSAPAKAAKAVVVGKLAVSKVALTDKAYRVKAGHNKDWFETLSKNINRPVSELTDPQGEFKIPAAFIGYVHRRGYVTVS